jgi:hypothetical protein
MARYTKAQLKLISSLQSDYSAAEIARVIDLIDTTVTKIVSTRLTTVDYVGSPPGVAVLNLSAFTGGVSAILFINRSNSACSIAFRNAADAVVVLKLAAAPKVGSFAWIPDVLYTSYVNAYHQVSAGETACTVDAIVLGS